MPIRPCRAINSATSNGKRGSCARVRAPAASSARAKRRTCAANSFCSAVNSKFITAFCSLRLQAGGVNDGRPLRLFTIDNGSVLFRRGWLRLAARVDDAGSNGVVGERGPQFLVQPRNNRRRCASRREETIGERRVEAREAGFG